MRFEARSVNWEPQGGSPRWCSKSRVERGQEMPADADRRIAWLSRGGGAFLRALGATWRFRAINEGPLKALRAAKKPFIFVLWHGQLLPLLYRHQREGVAVLISEHGDGEIIARIAMDLGYETV